MGKIPRWGVVVAMVLVIAGSAGGQTPKDCTSAYNFVTTCLSYVSGNNATPPAECCNGISYLNTNDPDCLCELVKTFNASSTPGVNTTRVYMLPTLCSIVVDTVRCPLALAPGASVAPTPPGAAMPPPPPVAAAPPTSAAAPPTNLFVAFTSLLAATHLAWNALSAT